MTSTNNSVQQRPTTSKKHEELSGESSNLFGLDRNLLIAIMVGIISIGVSGFLFKEVKKLSNEIRSIKLSLDSGDPENSLQGEKIQKHDDDIKAISTKIDQLIRVQQIETQRQAYLHQQQQHHQQQQQQQQQHIPPLREPREIQPIG